jgi:Zn-dependent protease with chaperone function
LSRKKQSHQKKVGSAYDVVRRVASRLVHVVDTGPERHQWQVAVVQNTAQNAFCLPEGKIVVYTGILPVAQNEPGLATVLGHEMQTAGLREA